MGLLKVVRGQERASELLGRSLSGGRLAHAYLFAGPSGVGRLTAALELAAAKMCSVGGDGYCGECRDCARVFHFQHPDVMLTIPRTGSTAPESVADLMETRAKDGITPLRLEGNTRISIQQVRELQDRLSRKAYEDRGHVEIILDADRMGVEAANSLLKTLEEPPEDTVLVLLSSRWSALLPTVRSRTQLIRFRRLDEGLIRDILMERLDIEGEEAEQLARISDGRPGLVLSRSGGASGRDTAFAPSSIISRIEKCDSVSGALSLASEVSRKLGREGSLEFCRDMQTFLHDLRRREIGMRPLSHTSESTEGFGLSYEAHSLGMELFRKAEVRLAGNGRAAVVLSAAFSGMWEVLRHGGRGGVN
ncbi:MAG: DNA polymerase III subunit [Candidatus Aegiribacteria sp.]